MSVLPSSWVTAPLGEFTIDCGQRVPDEAEEFKYIDIGSINREAKRIETPQQLLGRNAPSRARKHVKAGDVLVSMTRPNLNAVALVPDELDGQIASTGFDVLRASFEIEHRWVSYLVRTAAFVDAMSELVQGALYPAVRPRDIRGFEAPLAPLNEQKRIADKLDAVLARVDACLDRLDRIPAILKRFRQSVLAAAISGQLTEQWRIDNCLPETAEMALKIVESNRKGLLRVQKSDATLDAIDLFEVPDGWSWVKNHRIAVDLTNAICAGPFGTIFKAKDFRDAGIPIIFLRHVGNGRFLTVKPGYMDKAVWRELHQEYSVRGGELLVTKLGDPPGTACIYPKGIGEAMVTPDVMKMEVDEQVADPRYLMYFFNSPPCKNLVRQLAFGVTRLRIDLTMFKNFPIPLPTRAEQTEIVRRVEALFACADRLEARHTAARAQVEKLTPATLAKAFRGELVPQDPNDEPASELLERIQAQLDNKPKARK